MEKLVYLLWNDAGTASAQFNGRLLGDVRRALQERGASRLQFNVVDDAIDPTGFLRIFGGEVQVNLKPMPVAMVSFWLNSAHVRASFEETLQKACSRIAGYLVTESTVHPHLSVAADGQRTDGFSQVAFLRRPPRLPHDAWLEQWFGTQTKLAAETQAIFYYSQNLVARPLTYGAPHFDAVVEECWPMAAMRDPDIFFKGEGSPERQEANRARLAENVQKFLDYDKVDLIWTSQYRFGGWKDLEGQPGI